MRERLLRALRGADSNAVPPAPAAALPEPQGFTAHNIRLDDDTETYPQAGFTMGDSTILHAVRRTLELVFPEGLHGRTIMDIGCLEGGFATEFARLGLTATGLEVRDSNFANCLRVKAATNLPHLSFVQDDAMNIGNYPPVDAMFVCGLLYHLDRPRQFLEDAARVCKRVIFLETHVAPAEDGAAANTLYKLSALTEHEGLRGRWFGEYGDVTPQELDRMKWASWSNDKSFWIQKEHLLQLLKELGFGTVYEQFDCEENIVSQYGSGWRRDHARVLVVGVR